jgi:hypothetical protein
MNFFPSELLYYLSHTLFFLSLSFFFIQFFVCMFLSFFLSTTKDVFLSSVDVIKHSKIDPHGRLTLHHGIFQHCPEMVRLCHRLRLTKKADSSGSQHQLYSNALNKKKHFFIIRNVAKLGFNLVSSLILQASSLSNFSLMAFPLSWAIFSPTAK